MHTFRPYLITVRNFICIAASLMIALGGPFVEAASAATRYVNIGGVDTGDCSVSSPGCATIGYAMLNSVSGDTIQVGAGVYNGATGEVFPIYPKDGVRLTGAGLAGAGTTTICGDAGTTCLQSPDWTWVLVYDQTLTNPSNSIVEGIVFSLNSGSFGSYGVSVGAYGGETVSPTIRNNTLIGGYDGIRVYAVGYSANATASPVITNNRFTGSYNAITLTADNSFATATPQVTNNTIDATYDAVIVEASRSANLSPTIQGNTITGVGSWAGIYLHNYTSSTLGGSISGNNISGRLEGIWLRYQAHGTRGMPTISNNTISGNGSGIFISGYYAYQCGEGCWGTALPIPGGTTSNPALLLVSGTITGNTISNNSYGIYIYADDRMKISPTITGGSITNNNVGVAMNAYYLGQASPTIQNTTISGSSAGIDMYGYIYGYVYGGITWSSADPKALIAPIVTGNTITGGNVGIDMYANSGVMVRPTIQNNTVTNNTFVGVNAYAYFSGYIQPTIDHNFLDSNGLGLNMGSTYWSFITPTIQNNTITNNTDGISAYVSATGYVMGSIKRNEITGNTARGIAIDIAVTGAGVTSVISENTISSNGGDAVFLNIASGMLPPTLGSGTPTSSGRNTLMGGSGADLFSYFWDTGLMAEDNWWSSPPTVTGSGTLPTMTRVNSDVLGFTVSPTSGGLGTPITITANTGTRFVQSTGHLDKPILVSFGSLLATSIVVSADGKSLTALAPDGVVGASNITVTNPAGQSGTLASGFNYTYSNLPSVPVPLSPYNGSTGVTSPVSFSWKKSTDPKGGPVNYDLYLCDDPTFAACPSPVNGSPIASLESQSEGRYAAAGGGLGLALLAMVIGGAAGVRRRRAAIAAAMCLSAASLGIVACGDLSLTSSGSGGTTQVTMSFGDRGASAIPDTVTSIRVLITGEGMNEIDESIAITGSSATATFDVPDGSNRHIEAFAMDAMGQTLYYGDEYVDLMGLPVSVSLSMGPYNAVIYVYSGPLSSGMTYYWKVVAKDSYGNPVQSNVFSFIAQ